MNALPAILSIILLVSLILDYLYGMAKKNETLLLLLWISLYRNQFVYHDVVGVVGGDMYLFRTRHTHV